MRKKVCVLMVMVLSLWTQQSMAQSDARREENSCFASCMKGGGSYPGECRRKCQLSVKQKYRSADNSKRQQQLLQRQQELAQQERLDKARKAKKAEEALKRAEATVRNGSKVHMLCYSACYMETGQQAFCEKQCVKEDTSESQGEINTGDLTIDKLINECYAGCVERNDMTPACFHQCCYICNPEKYNEASREYEDHPWLRECKKQCERRGETVQECDFICTGGDIRIR